jgi:anti-anti-sigma factor
MTRRPSDQDLSIEAVPDEGGVRLVLSGELDLAFSGTLDDAIDQHANEGTTVTVDLTGLQFMDSSGLATILKAQDAAEQNGWRLAVASAPGAVDRVFDLTDTRRLLHFVD